MNCPAKTDPPAIGDRYNQNPDELHSDLTTRSDLGDIANARVQRSHRLNEPQAPGDLEIELQELAAEVEPRKDSQNSGAALASRKSSKEVPTVVTRSLGSRPLRRWSTPHKKALRMLRTYGKFIGPGFMVSVAYIDPGNYATDVAAGASYKFKLLFVVLLSNVFAIFLQSLCIHMGSVTGMNLAQMTKAHCPPWLNYLSWIFGEGAIIATDIAEVIGFAIALNLLSNGRIPLVAGCAISIVDVLVILMFFRQDRASLTARRIFEFFVALLVLGVVICFAIQLSYIEKTSVAEVFLGYVPSSTLVKGQALYQACGILGATVMPHSLYLGSGICQDRLKDFDQTNDLIRPDPEQSDDDDEDVLKKIYKPSLRAIRACKGYSIAECAISLFTFALFVNSSILIVAGASLYNVKGAGDASLFSIYHLLSNTLDTAVGKLFAVALLLSGTSAGIICTIAGQMVCEGQLHMKFKPWKQRLFTRTLAIAPAIIVAGALGENGINKALVGSQFALSVILPFVSAPLIWFTCFGSYMTIKVDDSGVQQGVLADGNDDGTGIGHTETVNMRVHWVWAVLAVLIWGFIVFMNVAGLVFAGLGQG